MISESKSIAIPAGGERYFTNAYIAATVVRAVGCDLPIQAWCLGPTEIDNKMKEIIESIPNTKVVEGCCTLPTAVIYQRRNLFSVHYPNNKEGHPYEDLCFEALEDLRSRWDGRPWALPPEQKLDKTGYASHWKYRCDGEQFTQRFRLNLRWDGTLDGGSSMEGYLSIVDFRGRKRIVIGPDFKRARLLLEKNIQAPLQVLDLNGSKWTGTWEFLGKHEIELEPVEE